MMYLYSNCNLSGAHWISRCHCCVHCIDPTVMNMHYLVVGCLLNIFYDAIIYSIVELNLS